MKGDPLQDNTHSTKAPKSLWKHSPGSLALEMAFSPLKNPGQQNSYLINTTDELNEERKTNLPVLNETLTEAKFIQELIDAAEQVKQGENQNGIRPNGYRDTTGYFQSRMEVYLMTVKRFVDANFPALPPNSQPLTEEYLNDAIPGICNKVIGLVQYLRDPVLEEYLLDSFNRQLFGTLHLLVDRNSTVKYSFFLLQWMKKTYFRQDHKASLITQTDVHSVTDPFLLADWLEYLKQKHLKLLQNRISTTLDNILQHKDSTGGFNDRNEETFIQVQLDVIQCLNASIKASETISHTLKNAVQRLCCDEFHCFIKRFYAMSIIDKNNDTDSSTLLMLENMETQSLSSTQQCFGNLARDNLKKYFNKENAQLQNMIVTILKMLAALPQVEQGEESKQLIVKTAYYSVTSAYLQCLTRRKYKKLEKRWGDVEKRILLDAEQLNFNSANQNGSDDVQKMLLLKVGEMLQCHSVDTLKLLCSELYILFPKER
ncbi:hypothetical protein Baya_2176 [Bagarius yarrelli]|uniref:Uncharacterized protein n=1 Tax=Bagarius yarrelli TaxID=175774 RepID=A0A556TN87_BAGYA|nr:hypothetical protein Baya_2176 [Bagarius yarrelli]